MAEAIVKKHSMEIEIREISKLESIFSPETLIHGIPWKVKVYKKGSDAEQSLAVYLFCANKDESPNWSLWGTASFKLLPFSDHADAIEFHNDPITFNSCGLGRGTSKLIKWNDLFDQDKTYVKDDTINLKVKITAENPNEPNRSRMNFECLQKCCENSLFASFRLTVTNVMNLVAVQSPEFKLRGLPWNIQISKMRSSYLGAMLRLNKNTGKEPMKMAMSIKLMSSIEGVQPIEKCIDKQYQYLMNMNHFTELISWDELVKPENGFVNDNSITLEIKIISDESKFDVKSNPKAEAKFLQMECAICLENIDSQDLSVTPCGHLFCLACIKEAIEDRAVCPSCNEAVQNDDLKRIYLPVVN